MSHQPMQPPGYVPGGHQPQGHPYPGHPQQGYQQPGYQQAPPQPGYGYQPPPRQGYQAPPGYPQQAPPYPGQQPYPGAMPYGVSACRICGCGPAANVTFRGHRGMVLMMSFLSQEGPFCRDCGLAVFREMTAKTLIAGWYGLASFFITPLTVLVNLIVRQRIASLPAPAPPQDGREHARPCDPGPPLMSRPIAIVGASVPVLLFLVVVLANL